MATTSAQFLPGDRDHGPGCDGPLNCTCTPPLVDQEAAVPGPIPGDPSYWMEDMDEGPAFYGGGEW